MTTSNVVNSSREGSFAMGGASCRMKSVRNPKFSRAQRLVCQWASAIGEYSRLNPSSATNSNLRQRSVHPFYGCMLKCPPLARGETSQSGIRLIQRATSLQAFVALTDTVESVEKDFSGPPSLDAWKGALKLSCWCYSADPALRTTYNSGKRASLK